MVIYIHMYYTEGESMIILNTLEKIIGGRICSIAVPLFYIISGYLFFLKVPNGIRSIGGKLHKRVRTLLIPYVLANILTLIFYVVLNLLANYCNIIDNVLNFKVLQYMSDMNLLQQLYFIFVIPPIAFQLWFVRDLMVVMLFSPVIYILLKLGSKYKLVRIVLILVLITGLIFSQTVQIGQALIWFISGGLCSYYYSKNIIEKRCDTSLALYLFIAYIFYCIVSIIVFPDFGFNFAPIFGIPALWFGYDVIMSLHPNLLLSKRINLFCEYTFFVYLCHEPLLNIFKKIPLIISRSEIIIIVAYIFIPPIFYILAVYFGRFIHTILPNAYNAYTGGR